MVSSIKKQKSREDESRTLKQSHTKGTIQSIPIIHIEKRNESTHTHVHTRVPSNTITHYWCIYSTIQFHTKQQTSREKHE